MAVADCLLGNALSVGSLAQDTNETRSIALLIASKQRHSLSVRSLRIPVPGSYIYHQKAPLSLLPPPPPPSRKAFARFSKGWGAHCLSKIASIPPVIGPIQVAILALLSISIWPHPAACTPSPESQQWQTLRPGLESITTSVSGEFLFSSSILAIRASPITFQPKVFRAVEFGSPTASAKRVCQASGASACINANFFDEQHRPLGTVISRGIIHKNIHRGGGTLTGLFVAKKDIFAIKHRKNFATENVLEAFQAGPRLIARGHPVSGIKTSSAQGALSILCIDSEKRIILAKIALSIFARYPSKIQSTLLQEPFNCIDALNLDGGGSSQLFAWGDQTQIKLDPSKVIDSPGLDMVPVVFALVARP
jgi:hypothetical protein